MSITAPTKAHEATRFDVEAVRREFPALAQEIHGRPLAYLDNAATAQKPRAMIDAVSRFYREDCSNIHRGVHQLAERATVAYEAARLTFSSALRVASDELVFTSGTTEAINLVARSFLAPRLHKGDQILLTVMEHHANIVPWQIVARERGARIRAVPVTDEGTIDPEVFARHLNKRTKMVAFTHVSNVLGTINPVAELAALARERGVPVLVDGAQALPHFPVDVGSLGVDFYTFSGHKLFGPSGVGLLWGKSEHLDEMPPYQGGGGMIRTVSFDGTTFAEGPERFEAGTPNIEGAVGLTAALVAIDEMIEAAGGFEAMEAHEAALLAHATEALGAVGDVRILGGAGEHRVPVLSFTVDGVHPHDVGTILDSHGVAIRAGHHGAQPLMRHFGVGATARASFAFYNTHDEVDALARGVAEAREIFR